MPAINSAAAAAAALCMSRYEHSNYKNHPITCATCCLTRYKLSYLSRFIGTCCCAQLAGCWLAGHWGIFDVHDQGRQHSNGLSCVILGTLPTAYKLANTSGSVRTSARTIARSVEFYLLTELRQDRQSRIWAVSIHCSRIYCCYCWAPVGETRHSTSLHVDNVVGFVAAALTKLRLHNIRSLYTRSDHSHFVHCWLRGCVRSRQIAFSKQVR